MGVEEGLYLIMEIDCFSAEAKGSHRIFLQEINAVSKGLLNLCMKIAVLLVYVVVY